MSEPSPPETLSIESPHRLDPKRGGYWVAWMGAATIAIALVVLMWPGERRHSPSSARESHLPFGVAEAAYAPKLQIDSLKVSGAENFLNQEVTMLGGRITNAGNLPVSNIELTVEFSDQLGQVVLRDSRTVLTSPAVPFAPGEHRDFEISFEHIPPSANIPQPAVRVSGILFAAKKE
jgi:hypothetical protein